MTGSPVFNRTVNTIYVVGGNGSFNALSMKTGRTLWKIQNFYDKTNQHNYGGLNEFKGIVYVNLGSMCDFGGYKGAVVAVSTFTRSILSYFSPSSPNPNFYFLPNYGGGVWGLGGVTIGDPSMATGLPSVYFNTGNCLYSNARLKEGAIFCESIIKTDLNLKLLGENKPFNNPVYGDNDFGTSTTYFNSQSEAQTSGCTTPLISALRKDSLFIIAKADTMQTTQLFQLGQSNRAGGFQQAIWDSYENLLLITNSQGSGKYAGNYPSGILAFQLNATCGLNLKWHWANDNADVTVVLIGPPGERVALEVAGWPTFTASMLDVKTGTLLNTFHLNGTSVQPPAVANGTMIFALSDQGKQFEGSVLQAFECLEC